jgi:hypothetical protein
MSTEHCNMIRGLVESDRLLEWSVEDGWEPLCKFLGKPVPEIPFPRVNDAAGFGSRMEAVQKKWRNDILMNLSLTLGAAVLASAVWWKGKF